MKIKKKLYMWSWSIAQLGKWTSFWWGTPWLVLDVREPFFMGTKWRFLALELLLRILSNSSKNSSHYIIMLVDDTTHAFRISLPFFFYTQEPFLLLLLRCLHRIRLLDLISFLIAAPPCILWWCRSLPQDGACAFRRCEFVFSEPECQNTMINKDWAHSIIAESTYIALTSSIVSSS